MMTPLHSSYDTIVIGAGPAGSVAAYQVALAGRSVLLLDRSEFPRAKVCGCCIAQSATRSLDSIGLSKVLDGAASIRRATIRTSRAAATIASPMYRVLSRETLDSRLAAAAGNAGAEVLFSVSARVTVEGKVHVSGIDHPLRARAVIVADGLGGAALADHPSFSWRTSRTSRMGVGAALARSPVELGDDEIAMLCDRVGYLGLVRLPDGGINAAAALDPAAVRCAGGPSMLCSQILASCGVDPSAVLEVQWRGTPRLSRTRSIIESGNIFVLGDAAGYVEPFTGEGMAWAIQSAVELSKVVTVTPRSAAGAWTSAHQALLASHHRRCRLLSQFIRHPYLLNLGIHAVNHIPSVSSLASRLLGPFTSDTLDEQGQLA